jgi:hypothetical protein
MVESREKITKPTNQQAPENILPRWIGILDKLIKEAQAST